MTQPKQTALARRWVLRVNTATVASPTWTTVLGIAEGKLSPFTASLEDDEAYDEGGWAGQTKVGLAWSFEGKLMRKYDPTDDTIYDTGQESLRTKARAFGPSGVANVQIYDREGSAEAYQGFAEVTWEPDGGKGLHSVALKLVGKGELAVITNPAITPVPVPIVSSLTPATGPAAGGTLVKIVGDYFTAVTAVSGVKFGVTDATSFYVDDEHTIYATAPAKAAATYDVTVTSATGTSSTSGTGNDYVYT